MAGVAWFARNHCETLLNPGSASARIAHWPPPHTHNRHPTFTSHQALVAGWVRRRRPTLSAILGGFWVPPTTTTPPPPTNLGDVTHHSPSTSWRWVSMGGVVWCWVVVGKKQPIPPLIATHRTTTHRPLLTKHYQPSPPPTTDNRRPPPPPTTLADFGRVVGATTHESHRPPPTSR